MVSRAKAHVPGSITTTRDSMITALLGPSWQHALTTVSFRPPQWRSTCNVVLFCMARYIL